MRDQQTSFQALQHNYYIASWLTELCHEGLIGGADYKDALGHFKIRPALPDWRVFVERVAGVAGALLFVAGVIFFMAWNWQNMHRYVKFALVELVFVLFAGYALLRWRHKSADIALLGASVAVGAVLALYGQVYQTGADAWELFRAWALVLVPLAILRLRAGQVFLLWLVASLWIILYQARHIGLADDAFSLLSLQCILPQLCFWAAAEALWQWSARRGQGYDAWRLLTRCIGLVALASLTAYCMSLVIFPARGWLYGFFEAAVSLPPVPMLLYFGVLALLGLVYFRFFPDIFFLSMGVFSLAGFICVYCTMPAVRSGGSDMLLLLGVLYIGLFAAGAKGIFVLRRRMLQRADAASRGAPPGDGIINAQGLISDLPARGKLAAWAAGRQGLAGEQLEAFFTRYGLKHAEAQPWYMKVPVALGMWVGSACIMVFLVVFVLDGLNMTGIGGLGVVFLAAGIILSRANFGSFALLQLGLVAMACGLLAVGGLVGYDWPDTLLLYGLCFLVLWVGLQPYSAKAISFAAALGALFTFVADHWSDDWSMYSDTPESALLLGNAFWLALMQNPVALALLLALAAGLAFTLWRSGSLPPVCGRQGAPALFLRELAQSAMAGLFVFMLIMSVRGIDIVAIDDFDLLFLLVPSRSVPFALAACTVIYVCKNKAQAGLVVPTGVLLAVIAWFAPGIALGLALMALARQQGNFRLMAFGGVYLGLTVVLYYYFLGLNLLHKSIILMGTGLALLAAAIAVHRLFMFYSGKQEAISND